MTRSAPAKNSTKGTDGADAPTLVPTTTKVDPIVSAVESITTSATTNAADTDTFVATVTTALQSIRTNLRGNLFGELATAIDPTHLQVVGRLSKVVEYGRPAVDPTVAIRDNLVTLTRQYRAAVGVAALAGVVMTTEESLSDPTPDQVTTAEALIARWAKGGRQTGGTSGQTRTVHARDIKVLAGRKIHLHYRGNIIARGTVTAEGGVKVGTTTHAALNTATKVLIASAPGYSGKGDVSTNAWGAWWDAETSKTIAEYFDGLKVASTD